MGISNRLKSVKAWLGLLWLGCALFSFGCADDEDSSSDSSQQHRHHGGGGGGRYGHGQGECPIGRILPVRPPRCRESNNYALIISARFPEFSAEQPSPRLRLAKDSGRSSRTPRHSEAATTSVDVVADGRIAMRIPVDDRHHTGASNWLMSLNVS
jgi:hypothetical protein